MERQQNIRLSSTRRVGANFDFNGNPITQNASGGVIRATRSVNYPCGCPKIGNIETCTCERY